MAYVTVPNFVTFKIWDDYNQGDKLLATKSLNTADEDELQFFKGEELTFIEQYGYKYCKAQNADGLCGFIPVSHVVYKEVYHDRNWFKPVCSRRMARSCLHNEPIGTFLIRFGSDPDVFVISMKTKDGIKHERFCRVGSKYEFRNSHYNTLDDIADLLQNTYACIALNFTLPVVDKNESHTENSNCQILTGGLVVAKRNFRHKENDPKYLRLRRDQAYRILGVTSNLNWYIMKDEVNGNEGFVPVRLLSDIVPTWYHGEQKIGYADRILGQQTRYCTFLVTRDHNIYTLSVRTREKNEHVPIVYKNEAVTCFNSTYRSIIELVNCLVSSPTVPMVRHPITNNDDLGRNTSIEAVNNSENFDSVELYFNALDEGVEHDYNIRIMLVGHYGAGKTTLASRLLDEPIGITECTDGIEIHVKEACLDVETGQWNKYTTEKDESRLEQRLEHVIKCQAVSYTEHQHKDTKQDIPVSVEYNEVENESTSVAVRGAHSGTDRLEPQTREGVERLDTSSSINMTPINKRSPSRRTANDLTREQRKSISELVKRVSSDLEVKALSPISVWDFAGQFIFYATHQVFMSSRALYILVLDLSHPLDHIVEETDQPTMCSNKNRRTVKSFIELWMKSIHMENEGPTSDLPAVLMVGTHKDKLPHDEKDRVKYVDDYFEDVRKLFDESPLLKHIQPEQMCIDARHGDDSVKAIQTAVYDICRRLTWWGEEKPARWIHLEQILINLQQTEMIVDIDKILAANRESQMAVRSEEEVRVFLLTQHNSGNIVYFEKDGLENTVVLQPQWIVDAFKSLITSEQFCSRKPRLRQFLNELFLKGVLKEEFIVDLWKSDADSKSFLEHKETILLYMENLNIIAKMKMYDGDEMFYLVPSLLPQAELDITTITLEESRSATLTFIVSQDCWHPPLFNAILAALIGRWNVLKVGNDVKLTSSSGVFELDRSKNNLLVVTTISNMINCHVQNMSGTPIDNRKCDEVRRFISATLAKQTRANVNELVELAITCDEPSTISGSDNIFKCEILAEEGDVICFAHPTRHIIDASRVLEQWFPDGYSTASAFSSLNACQEDDAKVYMNEKPLSDRDLQKLALALGIGWEHIGHSLGISNAIIDQCKMDYPHKTEMKIYQMLKKWKEQESRKGLVVTFSKYVAGLFGNPAVEIDWDTVKNVGEGI